MAKPWLTDLGNTWKPFINFFFKKEQIWAPKILLLLGKSTMDSKHYLKISEYLLKFEKKIFLSHFSLFLEKKCLRWNAKQILLLPAHRSLAK